MTIIVAGRDVAPYAREAIDSLRAQTFRAWRAVLVDDGSVDETGAIFDAAAAGDHRFETLHTGLARGLGAARNLGLDRVRTPMLGFFDADDVLAPTALERLSGELQASGSDFVAGAYVRLRPTSDAGPRPGSDEGSAPATYTAGPVQPWVAEATSPARRGIRLADHPAACGNIVAWSKLSRTEFWRLHGLRFPEGELYEDQLIAQRMYTLARAFDVIPDAVVQWRERAEGTSITQGKDRMPVLTAYLHALRAGLSHLELAGADTAAAARARLIASMDLPPLVQIARQHPDDAYRRAIGEMVRWLGERAPELPMDAELSAAALW